MKDTTSYGCGKAKLFDELPVSYGTGDGKGLIDPDTGTDRHIHHCLTAVNSFLNMYGFGEAAGEGWLSGCGEGTSDSTIYLI